MLRPVETETRWFFSPLSPQCLHRNSYWGSFQGRTKQIPFLQKRRLICTGVQPCMDARHGRFDSDCLQGYPRRPYVSQQMEERTLGRRCPVWMQGAWGRAAPDTIHLKFVISKDPESGGLKSRHSLGFIAGRADEASC